MPNYVSNRTTINDQATKHQEKQLQKRAEPENSKKFFFEKTSCVKVVKTVSKE